MIFVREASAAVVLVTLTLSLQCAGMAALIGWARTSLTRDIHKLGPLRSAVFMVRFTTVIIALHVLQILLWAEFYRWLCFPLWESAFYFSTSSYATVGYGDVVLPWMWRALGPVESIIGVLMCGLSASVLFAMVTGSSSSTHRSHVNSRGRLQSMRQRPNIRSPARAAKKENRSECSYLAEEKTSAAGTVNLRPSR